MKSRIDDIEILRAFAVLLVIIEHMQINLFSWGTPVLKLFYQNFSGWSGVDLFFVISGFVIAKNLVPRLQASRSRREYFRNSIIFWVRRFWRLIPSAWTWLLVILLASIFFNSSGVWGPVANNLRTVIAAFLQIANFHGAAIYGHSVPGAAFVYWSLSLEEQFYLVLPLLVLLSGKRLPLVLALIVVPQLFMQRGTPLLALTRTDALFLGVLLALWSNSPSYLRFRPHLLRHGLLAVITVIAALLVLGIGGAEHLPIKDYRYGIITCVSGLLVFAASFDDNYFSRPTWLKTPLLWVGTRSYALYLTHMPCFFMTREIWFRLEPPGTRFDTAYTWYFLTTAVVLLIVLSELNFRFIETPLRKHGVEVARRLAAKKIAGPGGKGSD